jgi:hypothetical protein
LQSGGANHAGHLFLCLDWESPGGDGTQRFPINSLPRLLQSVIEPLRQFNGLLRHIERFFGSWQRRPQFDKATSAGVMGFT